MTIVPHYAMLGHGPTVLLLHGSGGGYRAFAPQVEVLASLGFRAVAWDMPGYGVSVPVEPYGFKGLAASAAALIEAVAPAAGSEPVAVVGQGMGGMVAQELALRRPDLVRHLVLMGTAAAVQEGDAYDQAIARNLAWLDEGLSMPAIADRLLPRLVGPGALPAGVELATFCQAQVHALTWRCALQAMRQFDRRAALAQIHVPTLLVAGEQDRITPPEAMQSMAQAISGSAWNLLPGVGHLPHLEAPDEFGELLVDFLRTPPARWH
jgi:pimeloyl-ACP methyl ester carboxylesterase